MASENQKSRAHDTSEERKQRRREPSESLAPEVQALGDFLPGSQHLSANGMAETLSDRRLAHVTARPIRRQLVARFAGQMGNKATQVMLQRSCAQRNASRETALRSIQPAEGQVVAPEAKPIRSMTQNIVARAAAPPPGEAAVVGKWVAEGTRNENALANRLYFRRHPERRGVKLKPGTPAAKEWLEIRNSIVHPALGATKKPLWKPAKAAESKPAKDTGRTLGKALKRVGGLASHAAKVALEAVGSKLEAMGQKLREVVLASASTAGALLGAVAPGKETTKPASSDETKTAAASEKKLKDVLATATEIRKELADKYPSYGKGGWEWVTDDPEGKRLAKLHHTQVSKKRGSKEKKNIKYKVWKGGHMGYGEKEEKGQYVCTTFIEKVLEDAGFKVTKESRRLINVGIKAPGKKKMSKEEKAAFVKRLVKSGDPRTKGVVTALVKSGQGVEITDLEQLKKGDLVQYWYGGGTAGHVVIVAEVKKPRPGTVKIDAYGSHKGKGGIGLLKGLTLMKKGKKAKTAVWAVRPLSSSFYKEAAAEKK